MSPLSAIKNILVHPVRFWESADADLRVGKSMVYALTLCCIGLVISYAFALLLPTELYPERVTNLAMKWGMDSRTFVNILLPASYVLSFVALFLNAFFLYIVSKIFRSTTSFAQTYFITSRSATPAVLFNSIPLLGSFSSLWMEILKVVGIRQLQKTSTIKACCIVIIADLLVGILFLGIVFLFVFGFAAALTSYGSATQQSQSSVMMTQSSSSSAISGSAVSSAGSSSSAAIIQSGAKTYTNDAYHFSMNYPSGWRVYESLPGGRTSSVYAADAMIEFLRPLTEENRDLVLNGFRVAIYKNTTVEDYLNHMVNTGTQMARFRDAHPDYKTTKMQGFDGIVFGRDSANMMTTQTMRYTVLQVGVHVFEIEIVASEEAEVQPYIQSFHLINNAEMTKDTTSLFDTFPTEPLSIGQENAPATLTIFTDYTIGAAQDFFSSVYPELEKRYIQTGKVQFIIRQHPMGFNPSAKRSASLMECSRLQGKDIAIAFHKALSTRPQPWENKLDDWLGNPANLPSNLDVWKLTQCDLSALSKNRIEQDLLLAKEKGVTGVPEFFLKNANGEEQIDRGFTANTMRELFEKIDVFVGS